MELGWTTNARSTQLNTLARDTQAPTYPRWPAQALLTHPGQQHTCACARTSSRPQACKRHTNCTPACALLAGPTARITCPMQRATLPADSCTSQHPLRSRPPSRGLRQRLSTARLICALPGGEMHPRCPSCSWSCVMRLCQRSFDYAWPGGVPVQSQRRAHPQCLVGGAAPAGLPPAS